MVVPNPRGGLTVEAYEDQIRRGVLTENDRVELIRGEVIPKMALGPHHNACVSGLTEELVPLVKGRATVYVQSSIRLADSEPEPDLSLLKYRRDRYADQLPGAEDVLLLIEVADTSLEFDRLTKAPLYAANGIREYWIVNLNDGEVEVRRQPRPDGSWGEHRVCRPGERLEVQALPGVTLEVAAVLGVA